MRVAAVSNGVADDLADLSGIARGRITTIYNPVVGPDITALAQAPIDHPWLTNASTPVVLGVGRLDPQKDFVTLLRAFARVRSERALRLIILGASSAANPSYADELLNLARKLGVGDTVDFPGYVDNPFAYMARAQVFALSSAFEGLPGVLIEALACGCQVVATDCPSGPREILAGGKFGPLVPVGDDVAMAEALKQALDRPRPSESLTERANVFSIDRSVDDYLKVLLDPDDSPATGVSQPPPMATP